MHEFLTKIIAEFAPDQTNLSAKAMALAVDQLKKHAQENGRTFNCFVVDRNEIENNDELIKLLQLLEKNKEKISNQRIQVIYHFEQHWSVIDVEINNGALNFFLLDAANCIPKAIYAALAIRTYCPDALIHYCGSQMQRDGYNCAYFSLFDAYELSKIQNLHNFLPKIVTAGPVNSFANYAEYYIIILNNDVNAAFIQDKQAAIATINTINVISFVDLPKEFGPLIEIIQSVSTYEVIFASKGFLSHKGDNLGEYIKKHMVFIPADSPYQEPRRQNDALKHKRTLLQENTLAHIQKMTEEECALAIANCQGFNSTLFVHPDPIVTVVPKFDESQEALLNATDSIKVLPANQLPKEFGPMIEDIQSMQTFKNDFAGKGFLSHKGTSLDDYIQAHSETVAMPNGKPPATRNLAIEHKRDFLKKFALEHLNNLGDKHQQIIAERQGFNGPMFAASKAKLANSSAMRALIASIEEMKAYGSNLTKTGAAAGKTVTELADTLNGLTNKFLQRNNSKKQFNAFQNEFKQTLHSKDAEMAQHRALWKVITANVLLALSCVGLVCIMIKSISQNKFSLFWNKTQRENNVAQVEERLNAIA